MEALSQSEMNAVESFIRHAERHGGAVTLSKQIARRLFDMAERAAAQAKEQGGDAGGATTLMETR